MATVETPLLADLPGDSPSPLTKAANDSDEGENPNRPNGLAFAIVYACILMGDFLVCYGTSCVTTLTPVITDEFRTIDDVGWYGIAYLLAMVSTLLTFGQLYTIYPMKAIFLASCTTFALGSLVSASASSSVAFIAGRAISGLGGSEIFAGGSIIVAKISPLASRPIYQAISGGMECVALSVGPLAAGAIKHASSWRVAFYIIVPVALCNIAAIGLFVQGLPQPKNASLMTKEKRKQLDLVGFAFVVPATVYDTYDWTSSSQWISYQILFGTGAGLAFQQSHTAIQVAAEEQYVATALAVLSFVQEMGGIAGLAVAGNVFLTGLTGRLEGKLPGDVKKALQQGMVSLPNVFEERYRAAVLQAYEVTIRDVFYIGLVAACAAMAAVGIEWRSVRVEKDVVDGRDGES